MGPVAQDNNRSLDCSVALSLWDPVAQIACPLLARSVLWLWDGSSFTASNPPLACFMALE